MLATNISILIPTYNNHQELAQCLYSIRRLTYNLKLVQIIIIDNANDPKLIKKITSHFPFSRRFLSSSSTSNHNSHPKEQFLVLSSPVNLGYTQAINQAVPYAIGKFLLFTNDDLEFTDDCISILYNYLSSHPTTGIVGSYHYSKSDHLVPTYLGQTFNSFFGILIPHQARSHPHQVQFITGSCLLISKHLFIQLRGFDESYSPGMFEDLDLCLRSARLGRSSFIIPQSICYHDFATTFNRHPEQKYFLWYRNKLLLLHKRFPLYHLILSILSQYLIITPLRGLLLRDGRLLPALKALKWYVLPVPRP